FVSLFKTTVYGPSAVFTVNVSPAREVITPLDLTFSPLFTPNAETKFKRHTANKPATTLVCLFIAYLLASIYFLSSIKAFSLITRNGYIAPNREAISHVPVCGTVTNTSGSSRRVRRMRFGQRVSG